MRVSEYIAESLLAEANAGTVAVFRAILISRLTAYDKKMTSNPRHNPYFLGHVFKSVQDNLDPVIHKYLDRDDPEAINAFIKGLEGAFTRGGWAKDSPFSLAPVRAVEKMAVAWRDQHVLPKM